MERGDQVSVIDQDLKGIVLSVAPNGKVSVRCTDGMDWEFDPKELVVTKAKNPERQAQLPKPKPVIKPQPKPAVKTQPIEILPLMSIAFLQDGKDAWEQKLCNRSGYHILASVSQNTKAGWQNMFSGKLLNGHDSDLAKYRSGDLNDIGSFLVQAVYFKIAEYKKKEPLNCEVKVKPKKFLNQENFHSYQGLDGKAMVLELKNSEPTYNPQVTIESPRKIISKLRPLDHSQFESHSTIDLHIELLVPELNVLSPSQMLEIQKQECVSALNEALANPNKLAVTIVHGHGKGTLKREVIKILKEFNLEFNQDLYLRTGQAAIEVKLK